MRNGSLHSAKSVGKANSYLFPRDFGFSHVALIDSSSFIARVPGLTLPLYGLHRRNVIEKSNEKRIYTIDRQHRTTWRTKKVSPVIQKR